VIKIGRRTGVEMWNQDVLSRRRLSAPAVTGNYVLVGDYDGYVHVLDASTGALVAREKLGGERFAADPIVHDGLVIFMDADGKPRASSRGRRAKVGPAMLPIVALSVGPRRRRRCSTR
jgi:outer membrane protein assembly factor BamB